MSYPQCFHIDPTVSSPPSLVVGWKSTSGSLAGINGVVYENVLYDHNPEPPHSFETDAGIRYFIPEDPPFFGWPRTPEHHNWWYYRDEGMLHATGSTGSMKDHHKTYSLDRYEASSFSAKQKFFFYCEEQKCPAYLT